MPDVHDAATRSRNMAAIRGADTKPELIIRKGLHQRGLRYRLNVWSLPGKPDLVFARHRAVLFVHGCFWHGHDCALFKLPETRTAFWTNKIHGNIDRDARAEKALADAGWRIGTVWECALKGRNRRDRDGVLAALHDWVRGDAPSLCVAGRSAGSGRSPLIMA